LDPLWEAGAVRPLRALIDHDELDRRQELKVLSERAPDVTCPKEIERRRAEVTP
jgi:hypothetical protein